MKKTILILFALFCCGISFAQNFNYQAVVRDGSNNPVANQSVGVLVRIIEGSPTGSVVYNEVHTVTSNAQGVITLPVGGGTSGANFQAINWSSQNQWIDIQVDITGGTNYVQIGTSKLQFVPYAMFALNSTNATNAGPFSYTGNVVSNNNGDITADDFVFGSSQLDGNGSFAPALNNRMFFDKSKAAFRAGYTTGSQWDEANVGDYSVALGEGGTASGRNAFSMGRNANATGIEGVAFGTNAGAFGNYSRGFGVNARAFGVNATAIGRQLIANSMGEIQLGQYSKFVSGSADTWVPTDRLFVIGNGQEDINLALNSDALVMLKNGNTTLNGQLTLDGDNEGAGRAFTFPAQDGTALQVMQTDGAGNVSWVTPAAAAIPNGGNSGEVLSTDGSGVLSWVTNEDADADPTNEIELPAQTGEDGKFLRTDGTAVSWQDVPNELPTGGTADQILSTDGSGVYSWVDQNAAAAISTDTATNITSNGSEAYGANDFIFGAPTNVTGSDIFAANRIFFDKSKAAIRIGRDIGGQNAFADVNIGAYSAAFGLNPKAAGSQAFAVGFIPNASGSDAIALGYEVNATSTSSVAIGRRSTASGTNSMTFGANLTSETYGQTTFGYYNTNVTGNASAPVNTDRLFVIGNGGVTPEFMIERSDALVMLKNGNTTLNGTLTIDGDNQEMGASYTLPAQDGNANQVMTTDGSGNVSWADASSGTTLPAGGTSGQILSTDGSGNYSWVDDATGSAAFSTTANVTSNVNGTIATDDFVFGSTQLANDTNTTDDDTRMFFDKSKGAFRVGFTDNDEWDDANVGTRSVAFGSQNIVSGFQSFAVGAQHNISGSTSASFGANNTITGIGTFSTGEFLTAEARSQVTIGYLNTAQAGNALIKVPTDRLFVIGNGVDEMNRSDALVMLKNGNTTLNGQLTIDGDNAGSGASYTLPAQDGTANQVLTTDGSGSVVWATPATGSTGAFSTTANVTSNVNGDTVNDDFLFGSPQVASVSGADDDNRIFFDKSRGAFRAGLVSGLQWSEVNTGFQSAAFGSNNVASGSYTFAAGLSNNVSGYAASALGDTNTVTGNGALASGIRVTAESFVQHTIGQWNTVHGGSPDASGWVNTDRLFVIGNGTTGSSRSDALVMLKNGNTTLNGQLTIDGDNAGSGASYTLPAQDGTANQVLTTDGSGNVSWAAVASSTAVLETIDEGSGNGIVRANRTAANYGNVGLNAVDLSTSLAASTINGATGNYATAFGVGTTASGYSSLATGEDTVASGSLSTAIGFGALAEGNSSVAFGENTRARAYNETVVGMNNTAPSPTSATAYNVNDRLFVIGNGTDVANRSDAMVVLKNGNTTINGNTTVGGDVTTDGLKINNLPAFNVTSNGTTYTSAGPKEVGAWNSTVNGDLFNDGTHLNLTNGRFTAPVDGLYFFSAQVRIDAIDPNTPVDGTVYSRLMIVKNGNRQGFRNGLHSIRNADSGTDFYDTQSVSGVLKLNTGDYVSVFVESTGDTSFIVQAESGFNGYLVNKL